MYHLNTNESLYFEPKEYRNVVLYTYISYSTDPIIELWHSPKRAEIGAERLIDISIKYELSHHIPIPEYVFDL